MDYFAGKDKTHGPGDAKLSAKLIDTENAADVQKFSAEFIDTGVGNSM